MWDVLRTKAEDYLIEGLVVGGLSFPLLGPFAAPVALSYVGLRAGMDAAGFLLHDMPEQHYWDTMREKLRYLENPRKERETLELFAQHKEGRDNTMGWIVGAGTAVLAGAALAAGGAVPLVIAGAALAAGYVGMQAGKAMGGALEGDERLMDKAIEALGLPSREAMQRAPVQDRDVGLPHRGRGALEHTSEHTVEPTAPAPVVATQATQEEGVGKGSATREIDAQVLQDAHATLTSMPLAFDTNVRTVAAPKTPQTASSRTEALKR